LGVTQAEAYEHLMQLSPFDVKIRLRRVLAGYAGMNQLLHQQESLRQTTRSEIDWVVIPAAQDEELLPTGLAASEATAGSDEPRS